MKGFSSVVPYFEGDFSVLALLRKKMKGWLQFSFQKQTLFNERRVGFFVSFTLIQIILLLVITRSNE